MQPDPRSKKRVNKPEYQFWLRKMYKQLEEITVKIVPSDVTWSCFFIETEKKTA